MPFGASVYHFNVTTLYLLLGAAITLSLLSPLPSLRFYVGSQDAAPRLIDVPQPRTSRKHLDLTAYKATAPRAKPTKHQMYVISLTSSCNLRPGCLVVPCPGAATGKASLPARTLTCEHPGQAELPPRARHRAYIVRPYCLLATRCRLVTAR